MTGEHLSPETAARLRSRTLPRDEIEAAVRHVAACDVCGADFREAVLRVDPPRHLEFEELAAIAEGAATPEQQAHLDECGMCRAELEDLRPLARPRPRRQLWWAAAAAILLAVIAAMLLLRRADPPQDIPQVVDTVQTVAPRPEPELRTTPRPLRADWQALVDAALSSGQLAFPAHLATLRASSQTLRGEDPRAPQRLEPSGIAVEPARPELRWPRVAGAAYVVSLFDGESMVAQSRPLRTERWTPARPLRRGTTYTWQVEATRGGETTVLPSPPDPPARFHVIAESDRAALEEARALHPDDHLLLAVLHARAGLEAEARAHLRRVASDDPRVRRLQEGAGAAR